MGPFNQHELPGADVLHTCSKRTHFKRWKRTKSNTTYQSAVTGCQQRQASIRANSFKTGISPSQTHRSQSILVALTIIRTMNRFGHTACPRRRIGVEIVCQEGVAKRTASPRPLSAHRRG
ncbi:unnamed protein product [Nesidiocoris tenuis]|uniref:Uncharacterized protein n=1 Tax=Nesidiocoris tenuis TaxID=355587 RepID=A0A6H5GB04_9HEMI|nr:unnamed protein product [Nesidiocoris tenuis]